MQRKSMTRAGVLAVAAALALPASAAAGSLQTGVNAAKAHTNRADAALDRAVSLWEANRDRAAARQFAQSRRQLRRAEAKASALTRRADDPRSNRAAAQAKRVVAEQRADNVETLLGALGDSEGRVERRVAQAATADTRGREKALAVLEALLADGLPSQAEAGILKAIAELSTDRGDEVTAAAKALKSDHVSNASKRTVAGAVTLNLSGQAKAAERLAELIADPEMPESAKAGLQRAYDAVTREQRAAAARLSGVLDRLPEFVRGFVQAVVEQAHEDAQGMKENRPAPPTGGPGEGETREGSSPEAPPSETPPTSTGGAPESPGSPYRP